MRLILASLIAVLLLALSVTAPQRSAHAQAPAVIGHGCTTAFYIDTDCDGCGDGVYQSGTITAVNVPVAGTWPTGYQITKAPPGQNASPFYSVSDEPDADDTDPTVCTTADWLTKWGSNEAGMENFLSQKKNFTNTGTSGSRVFYLALTGNDGTAVTGDPTHPFLTYAKILNTTTQDFQGGAIIVRGTTLDGQATVTPVDQAVTCTATPTTTGCNLISAWTGPTSSAQAGGMTLTLSTGATRNQVIAKNGSVGVSWLNGGSVAGATSSITIHYGTLTVTTPPSVTNLNQGQRLTMAGMSHGTYILSRAGATGGNGAYNIGSSYQAIPTIAAPTAFSASWGFTLDFNPCLFNYGNNCMNAAGSPGKPLYILAYPGEVVESDTPFVIVPGAYPPGKYGQGYLTVDGFKWWAAGYGTPLMGGIYYGSHFSFVNNEFVGGFHFDVGSTKDVLLTSNVFHDFYDHAIYLNTIAGCQNGFLAEKLASGDFDFNLDMANTPSGTSCGAMYRTRIVNNVFYSTGQGGNDTIHENNWADVTVTTGNIISYTGADAISLQSANYNALVSGNLAFDSAGSCYQLWVFAVGLGSFANLAGTQRWNDVKHNLCWAGATTDVIQGKSPAGALDAEICTAQLGTSCNRITGSASWIKNSYVANNVFVTSDVTPSTTAGVPLSFGPFSFPEQSIYTNNLFFNIGNVGTGRAILLTADTSATAAAGTYSCVGTAPCSFASITGTSWPGNTYQNPGFANASEGLLNAPWLFDFGKYNLH